MMQSTTQSHANCNTKLNENQPNDMEIQPNDWATALPIMQSTTQSLANCNTKLNENQTSDMEMQPNQWAPA